MSMRGRSRPGGGAAVVSLRGFAWDRPLVATLRHVSLPWEESLEIVPLAAVGSLGARDRLSLLAQFAAHEALLHFAGIADGELDPAEWGVVQKRGADIRLVRVGAGACDPSMAPPALTLAQQFAEHVGAQLDVLRQSWARSDAVYAEAYARLSRDVAADLRWVKGSATGAIVSPGPEGLLELASGEGRRGYSDPACLTAIERYAEIDGSFVVVILRGASPLERYSALGALAVDPGLEAAAVAEKILAATSQGHHVFIVADESAFDEGSRRVVEVLASAKHGTWLIPGHADPLPETQAFIVAPRIAARNAIEIPFDELVESPHFLSYLTHGDVPPPSRPLPSLTEPVRSYIGALALVGTRIPREVATRFLSGFLFTGSLEELAIDGLTSFDGETFEFSDAAVCDEAARLIPASSRASLSRVAAVHVEGIRAALLHLDAGDSARAVETLEATEWESAEEIVGALRQIPASIITPQLSRRYAHALIDCGHYRDAIEIAADDELVLARAERRMGDYATALARLERIETSFEAGLLHAVVLRLLDREPEAKRVLDGITPSSAEERVRLDYERDLLADADAGDVELPAEHYFAARLATYRALGRSNFEEASKLARLSHDRARTVVERIDASLDLLFAVFSAGRWDEARAIAVEQLREVEETQGDRAAGGILFTLSYLAADNGQWAHASQRIARLRHYYSTTGDTVRLEEIELLAAHLDFSRGRFEAAGRAAQAVFGGRRFHDQIREAAALLLDEIDWMEGRRAPLRSNGRSGNAELRRRHERIARLREGRPFPSSDADASSIPERLFAFRRALAEKDQQTARAIAQELDLFIEPAASPAAGELHVLRSAAVREYPFAVHDFDMPWCFAVRNRLGQWHTVGSYPATNEMLETSEGAVDWIACSERERLYLQGSSRWTADGRDAVSSIFRMRADLHRMRRLSEQEELARPSKSGSIEGIVGQSPAIREIESLVSRVARRDVAICILGESGTGKELVARAIHRQSTRRQKPFTPVNCAALPENLIESELFGHVRGAFTGAERDRPGLIETTDGGTLFLDEIGELPLTAQAKLLRFLQEGEFRRVGDTASRSADVRIVSATNRKLDAAVEEGRFRDDLYYRVRGVEVVLPPLRDRGGDALLLAAHFLALEREKHRAGPTSLSEDVEAIFTSYSWPGNVRELQNTIRAAHAMAGEAKEIDIEHLPERLRSIVPTRTTAGSYQDSVTRFKRDLIERSLLEAKGNQNRAASLLKMSRQALAYQIRELGILVRR